MAVRIDGNRAAMQAPFETAVGNPSTRREKSAPAQERPPGQMELNSVHTPTGPSVSSGAKLGISSGHGEGSEKRKATKQGDPQRIVVEMAAG